MKLYRLLCASTLCMPFLLHADVDSDNDDPQVAQVLIVDEPEQEPAYDLDEETAVAADEVEPEQPLQEVLEDIEEPVVCVSEEDFFEGYRLHIVDAVSLINAPNEECDKYIVSTTITLDNGLDFNFWTESCADLDKAQALKEELDKRFSNDGSYPNGCEVYFKRMRSWYSDYFVLVPCAECACFCSTDFDFSSLNDDALCCLPQVESIEKVVVEAGNFWNLYRESCFYDITLSDGSLWRLDGSKITGKFKFWQEGDHILVSLNPEGTELINIDGKKPNGSAAVNGVTDLEFLGLVD